MSRAGACFRGAEGQGGCEEVTVPWFVCLLGVGAWRYSGTSLSSGRQSSEEKNGNDPGCICKERRHLRKGNSSRRRCPSSRFPCGVLPGDVGEFFVFQLLSLVN